MKHATEPIAIDFLLEAATFTNANDGMDGSADQDCARALEQSQMHYRGLIKCLLSQDIQYKRAGGLRLLCVQGNDYVVRPCLPPAKWMTPGQLRQQILDEFGRDNLDIPDEVNEVHYAFELAGASRSLLVCSVHRTGVTILSILLADEWHLLQNLDQILNLGIMHAATRSPATAYCINRRSSSHEELKQQTAASPWLVAVLRTMDCHLQLAESCALSGGNAFWLCLRVCSSDRFDS